MNSAGKVKKELIAAAHRMQQEGLGFETWGNLSGRAADNHIIITPSGLPYEQLHDSDLVVVNISGETLQGGRKPSTELRLHLAIYREREDIKAIVHTHSPYAAAFAICRAEIPPALEEQAQVVGGAVPVAAYALPGSKELAKHALAALGKEGLAVLLANHGLVSLGSDLFEALQRCRVIERSARIILMSKILGRPYILDPGDVTILRDNFLHHYGQQGQDKRDER